MADVIGDYIAKQPEPQRSSLTAMRELIGGLLPRAEEAIAYGAPAWTVDGIPVVGFAASAKHWSYLPHSGQVVATMGDALAAYETSKGAIKVPADRVLNVVAGVVSEDRPAAAVTPLVHAGSMSHGAALHSTGHIHPASSQRRGLRQGLVPSSCRSPKGVQHA